MAMVVSKSRSAFHLISESFLQEAPIKFTPPDASSAPFRLLSHKKDLSHVARRYTMGVQSKSLKLVMNPDLTMMQHVNRAIQLEHPLAMAARHLDPVWEHVFAQMKHAFRKFGVASSFCKLVSSSASKF